MTDVLIRITEPAEGKLEIKLEGVPSEDMNLGSPEFLALTVSQRFGMVLYEAVKQTDLGQFVLDKCFAPPPKTRGPKYPCRCRIIDADGQEIETPDGTLVCATPDVSRPKIDKTGTAYLEPDGINVRIKLDDGSELMGYECWWEPIEETAPA